MGMRPRVGPSGMSVLPQIERVGRDGMELELALEQL